MVALGCLGGGAAQAQTTSADCELHVWPAGSVHSTYYGWVHGGTLDAAAKGRKGYPDAPIDLLGPRAQLAALDVATIAGKLGRPLARVVIHDTPLTRRQIQAPGPRADHAPACYIELIVDDIFLQNSVLSGISLRTLFRLQDSTGGEAAPWRFAGWTNTAVTSEALKDEASAAATLTAAFKEDFMKFTRSVEAARAAPHDKRPGK